MAEMKTYSLLMEVLSNILCRNTQFRWVYPYFFFGSECIGCLLAVSLNKGCCGLKGRVINSEFSTYLSLPSYLSHVAYIGNAKLLPQHSAMHSVQRFSSVQFFAPRNKQPWTTTSPGLTQILREPNQTT